MLMKYVTFITFILLLSGFSLAQGQTESHRLNQTVAALYQSGKFDEAIPVAEEIVELERKAGGTKNLVSALENLAEIRVARFKLLMAEFNARTVEPNAVKAALTKLRTDPESAEAALREGIKVADAGASDLQEQRVAMRNRLAWLLYHHFPNDPEVVIALDKNGRDKFEMRSRARYLKRTGEAESLFEQASKISAEIGPNSNAGLLTAYKYAEFALATGNLENAISLLEKCIADVERVHGKRSPSLILPLELYARALTASGQDDLAFEAVSRLVRVTGKSAAMPKSLVDISLRADKAFAPINSSHVESNASANKAWATLSGRSATLNASFDAMLAVSTHGRQYYDATGPIGIRKVPVQVLVDEAGKVLEAEAVITDNALKLDAEEAVRGWKFKPFSGGGLPRKIRGYVVCTLFIDRVTRKP